MVVDHFFCNVEPEAGAVFPLFGREIGFEDFPNFVFSNSVSSVSHLDISVKVLFLAIHNHLAMLLGRSLDGIHNDILQRTRQLRRIPEDYQFFLGNFAVQLDTVLRGHAGDAPADILDDAGHRDWLRFGCADPAIALPHREKFTAKAHILFDNVQFSRRARVSIAVPVTGLFQLLGQNLNITPDDGEWITQIVNKFSRRLTERRESFFLRELVAKSLVQFVQFASGHLALPLQTGPLDVPADHFAHLHGVKRFIDVIVSAEPERFLGGLERAEAREHYYGKMGIDFADFAQAINPVHSRHANIHHDRIGALFLQELQAGLDVFRSVDLIARLEQHAQAFAWSDFIIDNQDLGGIRRCRDVHYERIRARAVPCSM